MSLVSSCMHPPYGLLKAKANFKIQSCVAFNSCKSDRCLCEIFDQVRGLADGHMLLLQGITDRLIEI
jgi:hypothetical protein